MVHINLSTSCNKVDFDSTWPKLQNFIEEVIQCRDVNKNIWTASIDRINRLTQNKFKQMQETVETFLEKHIRKLYDEVTGHGEENILGLYSKHWCEYLQGVSNMDKLFRCYNKTIICRNVIKGVSGKSKSVEELAINLWASEIITPLKDDLVQLILKEVNKDRASGNSSSSALHGVITSFVDAVKVDKTSLEYTVKKEEVIAAQRLDMYKDVFENAYIKETGEYYRRKTRRLVDEEGCVSYMTKAVKMIDAEDLRSRKILHPSSYEKITHECEQRFIADHVQFLNGAIPEMVSKERVDDLKLLYKVLSRIDGALEVLISEVEQHVKENGTQLLKQLNPGKGLHIRFVEAVYEHYQKYKALMEDVFCGDPQFMKALDNACRGAINCKVHTNSKCKAPEWLAVYTNGVLTKSMKTTSENKIEELMSKAIPAFKYLEDKDIFQHFYCRQLATRLITEQSYSTEAEESMLMMFKETHGPGFIHKMTFMFSDMNLSTDLNTRFRNNLTNENSPLKTNFNVRVLQLSAWPVGKLLPFTVPQEMQRCVETFETFYGKTFSGRTLTWAHAMSKGDVKLGYLNKPYIAMMTAVQMAIMMPFNRQDEIGLEELGAITNLQQPELTKQLQILVDANILKMTSSAINSTTEFFLNMSYSNKRIKVKVPATAPKGQKGLHEEEVKVVHSVNDEERKYYLQAIIVRIMKARKVLRHNVLLQEVITQSRGRFNPNIPLIKKCIEILLEKEYIERKDGEGNEYSYIA